MNTLRTTLLTALVVLAACAAKAQAASLPAEQQADWLVSPAEALQYQGEAGFNEAPALRPRAVTPVIDILRPEPVPDLKVKAPFAIAVQFRGQSDAAIAPSSFKVFYGAFKLDITGRITQFVKVTTDGFTLENARIPVGKHRLTLHIEDEKQRVAERELRVEVE
jgi:hypothetical protein